MNIVDLLAILPYFVELSIGGEVPARRFAPLLSPLIWRRRRRAQIGTLGLVRVIRLMRIFRVMRIGKVGASTGVRTNHLGPCGPTAAPRSSRR